MKGIDIIIPVHTYNEEVEQLLSRCMSSLKDMAINARSNNIKVAIHIVGTEDLPDGIIDLVEWTDEFESVNIHTNDGSLDFCSQVNFSVRNVCHYDYFMVVEFDDIVTPKWINMAVPYIESHSNCPIFLPLIEVYDIKNPQKPLHYLNEIAWSSSFTENELGSLNTSVLLDYCNFNITGAIINRQRFIKCGAFKPSIKLSFGYELLLRLAHFYKEAYVVPKIGYYHFVNRDSSLTSFYRNTLSKKEGAWWIKVATEEYENKKEVIRTYTPTDEE